MMKNGFSKSGAAEGRKATVRSMLGPLAARTFVGLASILAELFFFLTAAWAGNVAYRSAFGLIPRRIFTWNP